MKAIIQDRYGLPEDVLTLRDVAGEVVESGAGVTELSAE